MFDTIFYFLQSVYEISDIYVRFFFKKKYFWKFVFNESFSREKAKTLQNVKVSLKFPAFYWL